MITINTPTTPVSGWTILCDFDGTISVEDVIDSLLDRFGGPGWEVLNRTGVQAVSARASACPARLIC